ncbi:MAG: class I SAM-dependent methyltransferase [Bacteroidota bacterium]
MKDAYGAETAQHYAAYRPPLHERILALSLAPEERFELGLDVGCGTGHSTHAAARWCKRIIGIEPDPAMLAICKPAPTITFLEMDDRLDQGFFDGSFDLATFAGSLFYRDPAETLQELSWLLTKQATIIVYDFDVLLEPFFRILSFVPPPNNYDHNRNFTGVDYPFLEERQTLQNQLAFAASATEVTHLLLSVSDWRSCLLAKFTQREMAKLIEATLGPKIELIAEVFLSRYLLR